MSLLVWLEKFKNGKIELILGSASKPRKEIVEQLNVPFRVVTSSFAEDLEKSAFKNDLSEYPLATAREKARDIVKQLGTVGKPTILVTCDTVVLRDKTHIVEKPDGSHEDACFMIKSLSGNEHQVATGVVVSLLAYGFTDSEDFKVVSRVQFRSLTDEQIHAYVATGEAYNKAGGYGVQGLGALLVEEIRGSYTNVVGIPLREVCECIADILDRNSDKLRL